MEESNLFKNLIKVKAPLNFEEKVLHELSLRKKKRAIIKYLRLSFAGAFCFFLVVFFTFNIIIHPQRESSRIAGIERASPSLSTGYGLREETREREFIPVIETLDFRKEAQISGQPQTIYILEQISEKTREELKY